MSATRRELLGAGAASAVGMALANIASPGARAEASSAEPPPYMSMPAMWISIDTVTYTDTYGAFRGTFVLAQPQRVTI